MPKKILTEKALKGLREFNKTHTEKESSKLQKEIESLPEKVIRFATFLNVAQSIDPKFEY